MTVILDPPSAAYNRSFGASGSEEFVDSISEGYGLGANMYLSTILLLMLVLPTGAIFAETFFLHSSAPPMMLIGKWFVFWSAGVRLLIAGLRQFFDPRFTAEQIFGFKGDDALPVVRELGVANFSMGVVGLISLARPSFTLPVAIAAAIFYGVAGVRHLAERDRTGNENIAMVSDLFVFLIFAAYVCFVELA
jgi:hypothetical protein